MEDFLLLDNELSEEERMIRHSVRRFVQAKAEPLLSEANEQGRFPQELIGDIAELGVLGAYLPTEYGCAGASPVSYGLICQEMERGDSALRSFVSVQSSLCMYPIFAYGNEAQKQRWLPKMASAELIGCFGLTEPNSGSDPASMTTSAKKVDGGWLLNGAKMWITNAPIADLAIVWAVTEDGICGFVVEKDFEGFERIETHHKFSLRASATGELVFSDCFVPEENRLTGRTGIGAPLGCLTQARFGVAWGVIGAAMSCFETVRQYLLDRVQFDGPLAGKQLIQKDLSDMFTEIVKAQVLNLRLGRLKEQNQATPVMVSMAKMNACREAINIARMARNLMGAAGISLEYPIIRHLMNLESVFTYEGTDNIHHLIIGQHLTGIKAF